MFIERDVVRLPALHDQPHPAVVLRVSADGKMLLVISGTGTPRAPQEEHLLVEPWTRFGQKLGLTKVTYFYLTATKPVLASVATRTEFRCPLDLFFDFEGLAERSNLKPSEFK